MNTTSQRLGWGVVAVVGLSLGTYLLMAAAGRHEDEAGFHLRRFGEFPVLDNGRVKPIDTLARVSLMILSGRQSYTDDAGQAQPAVRWLLDILTAQYSHGNEERPVPGRSRLEKKYRVPDPEIRALLNLKGPSAMLSYEEIADAAGEDGIDRFTSEVGKLDPRQVRDLPDRERSAYDLATRLEWHRRMARFETAHKVFRIENHEVLELLGLEPRHGYRYGFDEILPRLGDLVREGERAAAMRQADRNLFENKAMDAMGHVKLYLSLATGKADTLHLVAPPARGADFLTFDQARQAVKQDPRQGLTAGLFRATLGAYLDNQPRDFNGFVEAYLEEAKKTLPGEMPKVATEASFNDFAPFYVCMILYVTLFLLAAVTWAWPEPVVRQFAFWATLLTLAVHTWALAMRMYIQGRPPVTNLYSSAVFIGWVSVAVTLILERIYKNGIPLAVGTLTGAATLLIAHHLSASGDTLVMMQAVLDTNFWLATHVTAVTIGYSATFVAGGFGVATVLMVLSAAVRRVPVRYAALKLMGQCTYGVVCFAMFFSFLGTVLGGIWADESWGRFWGWDPKENGALLIVVMNALILHARWGGLIKDRGMATLAMVGNMVTMWSWFGTNQLGIGLHSYGFNNSLILLCRYFWVSQLFLIGLALVPFKGWTPAYAPLSSPRPPEPPAPPAPRPAARKSRPGREQILPGGAS